MLMRCVCGMWRAMECKLAALDASDRISAVQREVGGADDGVPTWLIVLVAVALLAGVVLAAVLFGRKK